MVEDFGHAITRVIQGVIRLAPFGIFGLVVATFSSGGLDALKDYAHLLAVLVGCMVFVALVINPVIVWTQTRRNPYPLVLTCLRESAVTAFFTRSSAANIPINLALAKRLRGGLECGIGDKGPMGRILVRGEYGHDIIPELYPVAGEPVVDKPGKGAFFATDLDLLLRNRNIRTLIVCGVTVEVCVHTTVREANDRGYECVVPSDCVASYFPEFYRVALEMIKAQGGIFGWVSDADRIVEALDD